MRRGSSTAVAMAMTLGFAAGCGGGGSKPPPAVAGCDMPVVSEPYLPAKYWIVQELYNKHLVTGEPRLSEFDALFSGGRIHDENTMLGWFTLHENDDDLLIDNRTPGQWETQLELNVFPKPYAAYHAYCTGWSFPDYASTHWQQIVIGVPSVVTPTSATP